MPFLPPSERQQVWSALDQLLKDRLAELLSGRRVDESHAGEIAAHLTDDVIGAFEVRPLQARAASD